MNNSGIKLFKISGIGVATLFGSVLAGSIIFAVNFLRMKEPAHARISVVFGFLGLVGIIALHLLTSLHIHDSVYIVTQFVIMVQIARQFQESRIKEHVKNGGKLLSNWLAFVVGIIVALPTLGLLYLVGRY